MKSQTPTDLYSSDFVAGLFDSMSSTYGLTNYVTSFGFTERWRHRCIEQLPVHAELKKGYDLMTGMGELWASLNQRFEQVTITGLDISPIMLVQAEKNASRYPHNISLRQVDVLDNDIPDYSADVIVCSFGLKTFNEIQLGKLAHEVARLLKPGGVFSFIEISVPHNALRPVYMFYLKKLIPLIGRIFQGNADNYRMLGIYTENFKDCGIFHKSLLEKGLESNFHSYFYGCATGVSGRKPSGSGRERVTRNK